MFIAGFIFLGLAWIVVIFQNFLFEFWDGFPFWDFLSHLLIQFYILPIFLILATIFFTWALIRSWHQTSRIKRISSLTIFIILSIPIFIFLIFGFIKSGQYALYPLREKPGTDWAIGEVVVDVKNDVSMEQAKEFIINKGLKIISSSSISTVMVVEVPPGSESEWIRVFNKSPLINAALHNVKLNFDI